MDAAEPTDRYAVVSYGHGGPYVSFWSDHSAVIGLLTRYANKVRYSREEDSISVWHRRSANARWVCITY